MEQVTAQTLFSMLLNHFDYQTVILLILAAWGPTSDYLGESKKFAPNSAYAFVVCFLKGGFDAVKTKVSALKAPELSLKEK